MAIWQSGSYEVLENQETDVDYSARSMIVHYVETCHHQQMKLRSRKDG